VIDKEGNFIIEPRFDKILRGLPLMLVPFSPLFPIELIPVEEDGQIYYINQEGEVLDIDKINSVTTESEFTS
jgi:hypothetical protein